MKERKVIYTANAKNTPIDPFQTFEVGLENNVPDASGQEAETQQMQQKSIDWFLARWDKFTGSRTPDLMKQGRGKNDLWGETAKKVILELASYATMTPEGREMYAIEQMYKEFRQTKWGETYEPEARQLYAEKTGYIVNETGFNVHPLFAYIGGSFDGEVTAEDKHRDMSGISYGIIEIKCPYDPIIHMQNLDLSHNGGIDSTHKYYGQIQHNIEVAKVAWCDFVSFDPRQDEEHRIVIIRVMRDEIFIKGMMNKIHRAQYAKNQYLNGESLDNALKAVEEMDIDNVIAANLTAPDMLSAIRK